MTIGKEVQFGIAQTSLFVTDTTDATTGSIDAMHDSLTPMGGFAALSEMLLNVVFGGKGMEPTGSPIYYLNRHWSGAA